MKTISLGFQRTIVACFAAVLFSAVSARAQDGGAVIAYFSGAGASAYPAAGTLTLSVPELATSSNPNNAGRGTRVSANATPLVGNVTTPWVDVRVEVGRIYHLTVGLSNMQAMSPHFEIKAPPHYRVEIEGQERVSYSNAAAASYAFRITPAGDEPPARAGSTRRLADGRLSWGVALGALFNGTSAGSLVIVDTGYGSDWSSLFTPERLSYSHPVGSNTSVGVYFTPSGVSSPYIAGALRQVYAHEALADIVPLSTTSYEIRFYARASVSGSGFPYDLSSAAPFVVYLIEKPSGTTNKIRITSKTYDASGYPSSPLRTAVTDLERTGTWPAYTWTTNEWNVSGQSQLVQDVRTGASDFFVNDQNYGYTTSYVLQNPMTSTVAEEGANSYKMFGWGEELISTRRGSTSAGLTTTFDYYTDGGDPDSYAHLKSIASSTGAWEAYEYYGAGEGSTTYGGLRIHRPYLNSPSSVPSNLAANTSGIITKYWYDDPAKIPLRLTSVLTTTDGTTTNRTEFAYYDPSTFTANGWQAIRTTRDDYPESSSSKKLTTITRHYRQSYVNDGLVSGQILSIEKPDGSKTAFVYQRGTWSGGAFSNDSSALGSISAKASQTVVIHGTVNPSGANSLTSYNSYSLVTSGDSVTDSFYVISGRSTAEVTIRDNTARIVRTEVRVWDGSAWQLVSSEDNTFNDAGLLTNRSSSNGAQYDASYTGEFKISETDATGVVVNTPMTDYDAAGRLLKSTRTGFGTGATAVSELPTSFTYDAASHVLTQTAGATGGEQLVSTRVFDTAGRLTSQTSPGAGTTGIAYDAAARTRTVTLPTTKTSIETLNADGSLASITGTGVVPRYFTHSIESDGRRYTRVNVATSTDARKTESWTDWLGRPLTTSRPGFSGSSQADFVENNYYDLAGHLVRTTRSGGYADLLYVYDSLGRLQRSGLDVTTTTTQVLDPASNDRVTDTAVSISQISSAWWLTETTTTYLVANSTSTPAVTTSKTRLSGFASGQLAESVFVDADGAQTAQSVTVDRANRLATTTTTRSGLTSSATEVRRNGLAASATGFDGRTLSTQYDALLRPSKSTDLRTGDTTIAYVSGTALVDHVTSPASTTVTYGHDSIGRVTSVTNEDGKVAYTAYDDLSRPYRQWGPAVTPAQSDFNAYGEQNQLTTWRGTDTIWNSSTWPSSPSTTVRQITQWSYDAASGLLASKTSPAADPSSGSSLLNTPQVVSFDYNARGQAASRTWARGVTTSYGYTAATGDLTSIAYSDGVTPGTSYTYTRNGQLATVTDVLGTRTFAYDGSKPWRIDREELSSFYGSRWLTSLYQTGSETNGMAGRDAGFQLGNSGNRSADLEQTWQFAANGNLSAILSGAGGGTPRTFTYGYATNTSLQNSLTVTNPGGGASPFSVTRGYETTRDLLTSIDSKWSTTSVATFAYGYTARGQRDWENRSGTAFAIDGQAVGIDYQYNDRGELTKALAYLGTNLTDATKKLPNLQHEFAYDNAGNRVSANQTGSSGDADTFAPDNANQLSSRSNKTVIASGTSGSGVTVAARLDTGSAVAPDRKGSYWSKAFTPANSSGPAAANVSIYAATTGNQARTEFRSSVVGAQSQTFTYDADGNLTNDGLWAYAYDGENRLISMTASSAAVTVGLTNRRLEFVYDYLGRRVQKKVLYDQGGSWVASSEQRFLYDGWNLIAEFTFDAQLSTLSLLRSYTWGLDAGGSFAATGGAGALLQVTNHSGSVVSYLAAYDGNGNLAALYDAVGSGAAAAIYEYSPFGELLRAEGSYAKENPFRYSTKFTDDETGLVNYGHRYYSPSLGRFINRDPIEEAGGVNLFGFCGNDPVNGYDVLGFTDGPPPARSDFGSLLTTIADWDGQFHLMLAEMIMNIADLTQASAIYAKAGADAQRAKDQHTAQGNQIASANRSIPETKAAAENIKGDASLGTHGRIFAVDLGLPQRNIPIPGPISSGVVEPITVVPPPDLIRKIEKQMEEVVAHPKVIFLDKRSEVAKEATIMGWQETDGKGGVSSKYKPLMEVVVINMYGQDPTLIKIHEEDHTKRLNDARVPEILAQKTPGLVVVAGDMSNKIAGEYLANQAALQAAKTMVQTPEVQETVNVMTQRNNEYLTAWMRLGTLE